jgi:hypothetical protein
MNECSGCGMPDYTTQETLNGRGAELCEPCLPLADDYAETE